MTWNHGAIPAWFRRAQWKAPWSKRNGVHYVGDDVIVDLTFPAASYNTFARTADFDTGIDGEPITTIDRGSHNAPSAVGGSPTYSSTHAYGTLSARIPTGSGQYVEWDFASNTTQTYYRFYVYLTTYPASFVRIAIGQSMSLGAGADGRLYVDQVNQFATPLGVNQWVRIEGKQDFVADTHEVRLYNNPDATTATETQVHTNTGANQDSLVRIGSLLASWGSDLWIDNVVVNADLWPGPYSEHPPIRSPVTYTVRDFYGKVVSQGQFDESNSWFRPVPPAGGWRPGWYRVYLTGQQSSVTFYDSYGVTNFCVIKDDAHFVPMPAGDVVGGYNGEAPDYVMKGVMGLGTTRFIIMDTLDVAADLANAQLEAGLTATYWTDNGIPDSERPDREPWCTFPYGAVDYLDIPYEADTQQLYGRIYCQNETHDGDDVFVTVSPGTNPSTDKIVVHYPDAATLVETWDNLIDNDSAATTINSGSSYIFLDYWNLNRRAANVSQTAIGNGRRAGVVEVVSTLYPLGVTRYEGPWNEPPLNAGTAHQMKIFQASVHTGNAGAKAIGPCNVSISDVTGTFSWTTFFDAGGGDYCDEISFHAYNAVVNGDMNLGRYTIQTFEDLVASYGYSSKPLWQTESVGPGIIPYGIYHPRRARKAMIEWLLFEQMGVPRERNNWWFDQSHGFWGVPVWLANGDGSLEPAAVLGRVLAEETWGKSFSYAVDFGAIGNAMYLGSVYTNAAGASTLVLMATSYMTGASVSLTVSGTSGPLTVVDGLGNEKTMPLSKARVTLPMTDVPTYVRLPVGASASVYRINGWSPLGIGASVSPSATTKQIDGVTYASIADDGYMTHYGAGTGIAPTTWATPPSDATLVWATDATVERVVVWCGPCWQVSGTIVDFDVETYDGATWTVRKTVTKTTPDWFDFGSDNTTSACFQETYWDEQWVFDIELDGPVSCRGVRLNVREASHGGEPLPDTSIANGAGGGQGAAVEAYRIQEIAVVDGNRYAGVGA